MGKKFLYADWEAGFEIPKPSCFSCSEEYWNRVRHTNSSVL